MDARDYLQRLPEPDPTAVPRIWRRFQQTRAEERRRNRSSWVALAWPATAGLAATAAAVVIGVVLTRPEAPRTVDLVATAGAPSYAWSEDVVLALDGHGAASGTSKDVQVDWESGTVGVEVKPHAGISLAVVTEEGTVRVVGTKFTVTRDALGVTTAVERGQVEVTCADGWRGPLVAADGPHTCLPVRAAALLGRADALTAAGAAPGPVLETLDFGLERAEAGSPVEGELLARRLQVRAAAGATDDALADADRYLASGQRSRVGEVLGTAGRVALAAKGCEAALPYLRQLEATGTAEDLVVLASCVAPTDAGAASALVRAALGRADAAQMDPAWRNWAASFAGASEAP